MNKKFLLILSLFCVLIFAALIAFLNYNIKTPASIIGSPKVVTIVYGMGAKKVSYLLKSKGLIRNKIFFSYYLLYLGKSEKIHAGEYQISPSMTINEIIDIITNGKIILYPVTIPEGLNYREIGRLLESKGFVDYYKFKSLFKDKNLLKLIGNNIETLEGYLFPETYHFYKGISEYAIIKKMISLFNKNYSKDLKKRAKTLGFTDNEVITFASLIEKETGQEYERELISSVFHNRLKKNMRLQCDPTVIYSLGEDFDGNIRKKDLMFNSPYNTYRYRGLPPGPIASPGLNSIKAVLSPKDTDNIYFVAKRDGSHKFSKTISEHNAAVRKYQLRRRKKKKR